MQAAARGYTRKSSYHCPQDAGAADRHLPAPPLIGSRAATPVLRMRKREKNLLGRGG